LARSRQYWLFKSEPSVFSIEDLARRGTESWDGVRNFQARNYMMTMQVGDLGFFYHSQATPPGIAGICKVVAIAHPDLTAQNPKSPYYDSRATAADPIWMMVDVGFVETFPRFISLEELKGTPGLKDMAVTRKGSRLSVQPVQKKEWDVIVRLARAEPLS
jgi:predicted RNA-binding protein with PUA-like domain